MAESVELATVLLTDLVGSTRLATDVGPMRADQLREEHFGLMRDAIVASTGREVKNTGDGLMVAFASASEAVKCAVAMQQRFEHRYRDAEQRLHVRIGLGAGESTVRDGDYFGMPSIEAARLCAQAPSDGILISAAVKMLAGRCEGVDFSSVGPLELKGFEEPVEAFSVSWVPLAEETGAASRWSLPAQLHSVPPVSYVGRIEERGAIKEARTLARNGTRQVVLLSGEPGIGKTRLASYAAHNAHAEGFAMCWGACSEELAVPYEPWIEICSQLVDSAPRELLQRHIESHGGELSRLARNLVQRIPELPAPQSSDPETERYLLFNAIAGLFGEVAQAVPLCVVLDDLHWADAQSLALLKHLLRSSEHGALQVVVTYRDSDLGKDHPLIAVLADLRSLQGVQRISLHGLRADEVAEIMTAVAGHELEADGLELAAQIARETDGNPFFVGEILRGLTESGALTFDEATARWSIDTSAGVALPESVREVIERRVERLGEEALEVLRLAAVIGREFDLRLLASVVGVDEVTLLDQVEAAVAASLLSESLVQVGRFRFQHALINQTLYQGTGATRRAHMHQRVAESLEQLYGEDPGEHLAELALHWRLAAVSVDRAKAADYALRAGRRALESLAPAEAAKLFTDAIEFTGAANSPVRCEVLIGLGEAQRQTGDARHRETLLEASRIASELADGVLASRAALANNRGYASVVGQIDDERLTAIGRALVLDVPPDPARSAQLLALQAQELLWGPEFGRRHSLADEAITRVRGLSAPRTVAAVLQNSRTAYWSAETLQLRLALGTEIVECTAGIGDPAVQFWAENGHVHALVESGDFMGAWKALERMRMIAEELVQPTLLWFSAFNRAGWEFLRGDLAAGERMAEQAFKIGHEAGQPDAVLIYGAQSVPALLYRGRAHEIVELLAQAVAAYPAIAAWRAALTATLCWLDRGAEAVSALAEAAADHFGHVVPGPAKSTALAFYADAAAQTRHAETASTLYELIQPWAEAVVWNGTFGSGHARMWLGLLAGAMREDDRADQHLRFASKFHEDNDLPIWAARGHLGWAEALAARGDDDDGRAHAIRALELSREHGYRLFEPRAEALLATQSAAGA